MNDSVKLTAEREHGPENTRDSADRERSTCPECAGHVGRDGNRGERSCQECGLVLDCDEIDHGPEWRAFGDDSGDPSRVGAPVSELVHDKGLSTHIGWPDTDAKGNRIDSEKRHKLQRLRSWNERFRTKNSTERNLRHAFGELERMGSAMGLPKPCRETAGVLYRRASDEGLLPGRSTEAMATAALYAAARQHGVPRTLDAFEPVSRVEKISIQRTYRYMSRELGLAVEPADPVEYLPQLVSSLSVSEEVNRLARELLEASKAQEVHVGRAPAGLAAAAVYAATQLANESVPQHTVAEAANVCTLTVRNRYPELLAAYEDAWDQ